MASHVLIILATVLLAVSLNEPPLPKEVRAAPGQGTNLEMGQVRPKRILLRFAASLVIASAVSFLLARWVTRPLAHLRRATHQIADGNFSARVSPPLRGRRDELAGLAHDFDSMAEKIQGLLQAEKRLLADISHELRSPLARIDAALELAAPEAGTSLRPYLERISSESCRLDALIQELLTLTRLDASLNPSTDSVLVAENTELLPLLEEVVADAAFEATMWRKAVELHFTTAPTIFADPDLLHRALENVVRNALRHTPVGTVVHVDLDPGEPLPGGAQTVAVSVRDQGPGVPEGALPLLFRPFYRVTEARDRRDGGVGLGLAITHNVVQRHEGQVFARNLEQGGLEVRVVLPIVSLPGGNDSNHPAGDLKTTGTERLTGRRNDE